MKLKKLLGNLSDLLDVDRREQLKRYDDIKAALKKLKKKRNELRHELKTADDEKRGKILKKLEIVAAQRRKGVDLLKELKSERKRERPS